MAVASTSYTPRRPQDSVLHRLVREHLATFVAHTEATYAAPLPRYVTDAFERFLRLRLRRPHDPQREALEPHPRR